MVSEGGSLGDPPYMTSEYPIPKVKQEVNTVLSARAEESARAASFSNPTGSSYDDTSDDATHLTIARHGLGR